MPDSAGDHAQATTGDRVRGPLVGTRAIYTVGHSTRSLDQLVAVLDAAGVRRLIDVRTVPRSLRHPQFTRESLAGSLPVRGIEYRHEQALGGFRRERPDSPNRGWHQQAFRGYADYMQSAQFRAAIDCVVALGLECASCLMCAEAQWWRCHRRLISDALVIRGWSVRHLGLHPDPIAHELTPFAVVGSDQTLTYPPAQGELLR
jgi:uncharacterized protein (DUF488 family)